MLIEVKNLTKEFDKEKIFSNVFFSIEDGYKVAFVGENGAGKSTILKIIAGLETPTTGSVVFAKNRKAGYLPQEITEDEDLFVLDYIKKGLSESVKDHIIFKVLSGLNFAKEALLNKVSNLSGGQQTKVLLTQLLLGDADVLLLDEPTNNLDIPSILWLEKYLKNTKKAVMIVSHDVYFLNNITDRFFNLNKTEKKFVCNRGSYTEYIKQQTKEYEKNLKEYQREERKYVEVKNQIEKIKQQTEEVKKNYKHSDNDKMSKGFHKDQSSNSMKHLRELEKRMEVLRKTTKPFEDKLFKIDIHPKNTDNSDIELENVECGIADFLLEPVNITIPFGTRICITGKNGSGKSTLLKTLTGMMKPISGSIKISPGVCFGDLMQKHERAIRDKNVYDLFSDETKIAGEKIYHIISKYKLPEEIIDKKLADLSCGTRARILFAIFDVLGVNILILDEPTNHLDTEAVDALIELLKTYKGTVILVSHNRWFLEKINVDKYYKTEDKTFKKIDDFQEYIKESDKKALEMINIISKFEFIK